jgi:LacI family transcriptional regulator
VKDTTRQRVLEAAKRLHYSPNIIARGLATGSSRTLALIVGDIRNPFYGELARGVEDTAYRFGFDLILGNSDLSPERQEHYLRVMVSRLVDGIILGSTTSLKAQEVEALRQYSVPVVLLSEVGSLIPVSSVSADNESGGFLAGQHLTELGHRRMAVLTRHAEQENLKLRAAGFRRALRTFAQVRPLVLRGENSQVSGHELTRRLIATNTGITAIFAVNDMMALGAIRAIREAGLRIPEDMSVVGFDNLEMSDLIDPPLTTINQPKYDLGVAATEVLVRQIRGGKVEHRVLGVTLQVRCSSGPAPTAAKTR